VSLPGANPERLANDLVRLFAIPSVNPFGGEATKGQRELEMANHLLAEFKSLGLETGSWEVAPGRPNVWGRLRGGGDGHAVMLVGHLDTVGIDGYPEAHLPRISEGRVYGRGACDMKAALACYLEVVRILRENQIALAGDLIISGLSDEEDLMIGSKDWVGKGPHADFGIIGEPTSLKICPAHKGQLCVFIRTRGIATHSSRPELGVNAVEHMGAIITHFAGLDRELQDSELTHPLCGTGRFSMNVIHGGSIASSIPDYCEMEVDRRFLPGEDVADIITDYKSRLAELSANVPQLKTSVSAPSLEVAPLDVAVDHPLVQALERAVAQETGDRAEISAFPGGTDAPNMGFPCVICGPGHLEQAHCRDEYVEISQMERACGIYLAALLDLNGGTK